MFLKTHRKSQYRKHSSVYLKDGYLDNSHTMIRDSYQYDALPQ